MIVFKYFFKILKKYIPTIIMFTAMLVIFGVFSLKSNNSNTSFIAEKPDICIINQDEKVGITKSLYRYLEENTNIKEIENKEEALSDALFYREISYIIYIPENYHTDFIERKNPTLEIKSSGDFGSTYAEMLLNKYLQTANTYLVYNTDENNTIEKIEKALEENVTIEMTSTLNNDGLAQATFYYNFANYSILVVCIYVVGMIMSSFREEKIKKRTLISCVKNRNYNKYVFFGIIILGIALWAIYYLISILLMKEIMLSNHGLLYAFNSFIFTICALSIAFLIGNMLKNKQAINGISNVIALGSAFICGSFVQVEYLPEAVLQVARILPSYWYIQNNELIGTLEKINLETLQPYFINIGIVLGFIMIFMIITNIVSKRKNR